MKAHQKLLIKVAVGLGLVGVFVPVSCTIATGRSPEIASLVCVVCLFVALTTILFTLLTIRRLSLTKMAVGLAIEGVPAGILAAALANTTISHDRGGVPYYQARDVAGAVGWGVFAIFQVAALTFVSIALTKVSKNSPSPRAAKVAKLTLQLFFPVVGLIVGGTCGGIFFGWLFCALWGTGSHMDGCGLAGLFLGVWPGAISGLLLGHWLGNRLGK